jgi:RNA polymerase sigma-70 factor (ECF subfamily)
MPDTPSFQELIRRVRAGDQQAAAEVIRLYDPILRSVVRVRLRHVALQQYFDSMDIRQSVLANFFHRAAQGEFELDTPEQLQRLLVTMARNKFVDYLRRFLTEGRDLGQVGPMPEGVSLPGSAPLPDELVANRELLAEIRRRLSTEERYLFDRFFGDQASWDEIGGEVAKAAPAVRMQLRRALDRILEELVGDDQD